MLGELWHHASLEHQAGAVTEVSRNHRRYRMAAFNILGLALMVPLVPLALIVLCRATYSATHRFFPAFCKTTDSPPSTSREPLKSADASGNFTKFNAWDAHDKNARQMRENIKEDVEAESCMDESYMSAALESQAAALSPGNQNAYPGGNGASKSTGVPPWWEPPSSTPVTTPASQLHASRGDVKARQGSFVSDALAIAGSEMRPGDVDRGVGVAQPQRKFNGQIDQRDKSQHSAAAHVRAHAVAPSPQPSKAQASKASHVRANETVQQGMDM